ncbi:MAG: hypothetical protein ACLPV8_04225 [Steroidobacteraceae bacterium]
MSFDDFFIGVVVGGIVLSGAYIRAEYRSWRNQGAAERQRALAVHELHAASLSQQQNAHLEPSIVQLQQFTDTDAAAADDMADVGTGRRSQGQSSSQGNAFVERRTRQRHQATN